MSAPILSSCFDLGSNDAGREESRALHLPTMTDIWRVLILMCSIRCAKNFPMLKSWEESNWTMIRQVLQRGCDGSMPIGIGSLSFLDRSISFPARPRCSIGPATWNNSKRAVYQALTNNTSWSWRSSFQEVISIAWLTWILLRFTDCDHTIMIP